MPDNVVLYVGFLWGPSAADADLWGFCGDAHRPKSAVRAPAPRQITILPRATWPKHRPPPGPRKRRSRFQADYARRAGVKGTMHQAASHGARRARYRGLPKSSLDHVYMACALNLLRLQAF